MHWEEVFVDDPDVLVRWESEEDHFVEVRGRYSDAWRISGTGQRTITNHSHKDNALGSARRMQRRIEEEYESGD